MNLSLVEKSLTLLLKYVVTLEMIVCVFLYTVHNMVNKWTFYKILNVEYFFKNNCKNIIFQNLRI